MTRQPLFTTALFEKKHMNRFFIPLFLLVAAVTTIEAVAQEEPQPFAAPDASVLDKEQWKQVDDSVKRGLEWLISQQQEDGSFKTIDVGQPGITAFSVMAFLAQGESPVDGKYQQQVTKAIDYIANQQKPNGLIATSAPNGVPIPRELAGHRMGQTAVYNHAISALALAEAYGQCRPEQARRLMPVIEKAIAATVVMQNWGGKKKHDTGGWRYLDIRFANADSDLSLTGWQLMFLRSARNAGFDPPEDSIDAAVKYVENCFLEHDDRQVHGYLVGSRIACTRAMAGAGVLALAHAGKHDSKEAVSSGDWILKHDFSNYGEDTPPYGCNWLRDRYHYGAVLCTQAMYQLGGKYWKQFFPTLVEALVANQQPNGAWPPERRENQYGSCYTTALSILSLSVPNQMLPIFQR